MAMSEERGVQRFFQRTLPVISAVVLLLAALYLAGDATRGLSGFSDYYLWVFALAGVALLVLAGAIGHRLYRLIRQLRARAPGSRLTLRLVILFVVLAVPPASVVYLFSVDFLNRSIDSWFDVDVEQALDDALEIGQRFLEVQKIEKQTLTRRLARRLADLEDRRLLSSLRNMVGETEAIELTVLSSGGRVIATSSRDFDRFAPDLPSDFVLVQARRGGYVDSEPLEEGVLQIRVLQTVPDSRIGSERLLQGIFPVAQGFDEQADKVEREFERYQNLKFLRTQLKRSFQLILSLVLLLSVLVAVLLAFNTARRVVQPIGRLADATRAVASGDYARRLPVPGRDELGFLVASFNTMTQEIARTAAEASASRRQAEERRDYLEAVLGRLSSGVLSFDQVGQLKTANPAAGEILGVDLGAYLGSTLDTVAASHPHLRPLVELIERRRADARDWQRDCLLERGAQQQVLTCRGARLPGDDQGGGAVLVFNDMTDLVRAQREAAWGEVARRLAHEVKNPLTPIQLSAERLRHKYLPKMPAAEAAVLDRATRTIVAQVEALKTMVNAFSDYARAPSLQLERLRLSELAAEILDLYEQGGGRLKVDADWMASEPNVLADRGRIRQLLHNLVKNAQEAVGDGELKLALSTRLEWRNDRPWLCLSMRDNGPGLPPGVVENLFEPYATTKERGTGIGLAIAKKIAEEHGGEIHARNAANGGAVFEFRLPVEVGEAAAGSGHHRARTSGI